MTDFAFTELVSAPLDKIETAALGASTAAPLAQADVGKILTLASAQNYVISSTGDDIEGILDSVSPNTVNGGFGLGGVRRTGRAVVEVAAAQVGAIAIGAEVVAGIQIVAGTAGAPMVIAGTGTVFKWRVLRHITGTGAAGDSIIIERC